MTLSDEELHALAVHPRVERLHQEIAELSIALKMHDCFEHVPPVLPDSDEIIAGIERRRDELNTLQGESR
jgi:hypothetical protein